MTKIKFCSIHELQNKFTKLDATQSTIWLAAQNALCLGTTLNVVSVQLDKASFVLKSSYFIIACKVDYYERIINVFITQKKRAKVLQPVLPAPIKIH